MTAILPRFRQCDVGSLVCCGRRAVVIWLLVLTCSASAATSNWAGGASGLWNNAANWSNGVPNGVGEVASFPNTVTATTTLDIDVILGRITANSASYAWTIAGQDRSITMNNGAAEAVITNSGRNSITIVPDLVVTSGGLLIDRPGTSTTGYLTFNGAITGTGNLTVSVVGASNRAAYLNGGVDVSGTVTTRVDGILGTIASLGSNVTQFVVERAGSGNGYVTVTGPGTFAGETLVRGGVLRLGNAAALGTSPGVITLDGGVVEGTTAYNSFTQTLGEAAGNLRVLGGRSGFSALNPTTVNLAPAGGSAGGSIRWGSEFFSPTTLVLNDDYAAAALSVENGFDFDGQSRTIQVVANTATISGPLTDSAVGGGGGLVKSGAGTLSLSGAGTYAGQTRVTAGTLAVVSLNNLGTGGLTPLATSSLGAPTTVGNATIEIGTGSTAATFRYLGTGEITDRPLDLAGTTGGATLDHSGSGPLTLRGAVTASGGGAKLMTLTGTGSGEIAGPIGDSSVGATSITKTGAGTWTLSGASTFSGQTNVNGGTLATAGFNNLGTGGLTPQAASSLGAPTTVADATININSATLRYVGSGETTDRRINLAGTTGGATLDQSGTGLLKFISNFTATGNGAKTLTLTGSGAGEIAGAIVNSTSATSVSKTGAGTWTLSAANTFTGTTSISTGTLRLANPAALPVSTATTVEFALNTTAGSLELASDTSAAAYNVRLPVNNSNFTVGTIVANRATPGSAEIVHQLGELRFGGGAGSARLDVAGGDNVAEGQAAVRFANLQITTQNNSAGAITLAPTTARLVIAGFTRPESSATSGTLTLTFAGSSIGSEVTGNLTNAPAGAPMGITKSGTSLWIFSGTNTYTRETLVNDGVLRANDGVGLPAASNLRLVGGVLETGTNLIRNGGSSGGQMRLTDTGTAGFSARGGPVQIAFGTASLTNLTWGTAPFQMGTLVLNAATANDTLEFRNAIALGSSVRTVRVDAAPEFPATISGTLTSSNASGGITKLGTGTLILSAANTYTGPTTVSAGTLVAGIASAFGSTGSVSIAAAATLGIGDGVDFRRPLSITTGGRVRAGNNASVELPSAAALQAWESLSPLATGTLADILYGTGPAGTRILASSWQASPGGYFSDILDLTGTGADTTWVLSMQYDAAATAPALLNIHSRSGGSEFAAVGTDFLGTVAWRAEFTTPGQYGVDLTAGTVWVVTDTNSQFVVAVPEPGTALLAAAAGAVAALAARRGRRAAAEAGIRAAT